MERDVKRERGLLNPSFYEPSLKPDRYSVSCIKLRSHCVVVDILAVILLIKHFINYKTSSRRSSRRQSCS